MPFGQHQDTELRVLVLTKKHVGSGDEIALSVAKRQVIRESFIISCMYGRGVCVCVCCVSFAPYAV